MASCEPINDIAADPVCVVVVEPLVPVVREPSTQSMPICNGMPGERDIADLTSSLKKLGTELVKKNTRFTGLYNFHFPGVTDVVASIYWDILIAMARWLTIEDCFTNPELRLIVKTIDNHDYVKDAYPDTDVGWHGLLIDSGIFRAIGRYKKQFDNPQLVSIKNMCSALTTPMPKHLYYLTFQFGDGSCQIVKYSSGDELLNPILV